MKNSETQNQEAKMTYYDHAKNHVSAAVGSAVARARRDAIAVGDAYKVTFSWDNGKTWVYWNGCAYDALGLAREVKFNRGLVTLENGKGHSVDIAGARY